MDETQHADLAAALRKVVGHVDSVLLLGAHFAVLESGRQRAVVSGFMVGQPTRAPAWKRVHCDLNTSPTFVWDETGEIVHAAWRVYIGPEGMYAEKPLEISGS